MLPVHNHSHYSALDGYATPTEIADRIEQLGLPGAFLTDHGTVAGHSTFREAMTWKDKKKGIKRDLFIGYGMEAYQAQYGRYEHKAPGSDKFFKKGEDEFHLILLAASKEGYLNLMRISDESNRTGYYWNPRVDWDLLKKYREGIIATSACFGSLIHQEIEKDGTAKSLKEFRNIFGDNFLIELHTYDTDKIRESNQKIATLAQEMGIRTVYANDAHYAFEDDFDAHEALLCAQYGELLEGKKRYENYSISGVTFHNPPCLYIMSEQEVRAALNHLPEKLVDEAITTSDWLMERCNFQLDPPVSHLPKFKDRDYPEDTDWALVLIDKVEEGIERLYGDNQEAWARAEYELQAIIDAGLHEYFLIVWDFVHHALDEGEFVGPGRGSAGGSIISYALGITSIDPLKYGLQFERFWNPGRESGLPDIDIDFSPEGRDKLIQYVRNKYGEGKVLPIGNHTFMRPKAALTKAAMVLFDNPPYADMKVIKSKIDSTNDAGQVKPWAEMMEMVGDDLAEYIVKYPDLFALAEDLEGRISNYAIHASAVVISDVELTDYLPARMATDDKKRKELVTQAEMRQVEDAGFPKFDFLGLRNLSTIMRSAMLSGDFGPDTTETRKNIINHFRHEIDWDNMPDEFWKQCDNGFTLGLFQIEEGDAARRIAKHLHPRNIEDLGAIVALNRPGPLRAGVVDRFLECREGEATAGYAHPILEPILESTYGDFLYQEQVISYFREIGYSLSDADHIRKILGKKLVDDMKAEYPIYMKKASDFMSREKADVIWQGIQNFSKYSFNKSHSIGYGTITAWTMYAKWKWPVAFIMASIETNSERIAAWINEARRIGVEVLPPDINRSDVLVSMDGEQILYGLQNIKGIGASMAKWVIKHRPFESPEHFVKACSAVTPIVVNAGHQKKLIESGALDSFGYRLGTCVECKGKGRRRIDPEVRKLADCPDCDGSGWQRVEIPDKEIKAKLETEYLQIALTDVWADKVAENQAEIDRMDSYSEALEGAGNLVRVPGVVLKVNSKKAHWTKRPEDYAHVTIEWAGEELTFVAFPPAYREYGYVLKPNTFGWFKVETSPKGPQLREAWKW